MLAQPAGWSPRWGDPRADDYDIDSRPRQRQRRNKRWSNIRTVWRDCERQNTPTAPRDTLATLDPPRPGLARTPPSPPSAPVGSPPSIDHHASPVIAASPLSVQLCPCRDGQWTTLLYDPFPDSSPVACSRAPTPHLAVVAQLHDALRIVRLILVPCRCSILATPARLAHPDPPTRYPHHRHHHRHHRRRHHHHHAHRLSRRGPGHRSARPAASARPRQLLGCQAHRLPSPTHRLEDGAEGHRGLGD